MKRFVFIIALSLCFNCLLGSCRGEKAKSKEKENEVLIARLGNNLLFKKDIEERIPRGLSSEDSLALATSIVKSWIESNLLLDYAENNISNLKEIDKMVDRFRNQLIIEEYKRNLRIEASDFPEDSIKKWYDTHRESYRLQQPLIKGIFIKLPSKSEEIEKIASLIASDEEKDLDVFENELIGGVSQYSYFRDEWIDWDIIEDLIPYNFGNADEFLKNNKEFRTEYKGMTYILTIQKYVPSGEVMPYEHAARIISNDLKQQSAFQEEKKIINTIYDKALKEGKLEINSALVKTPFTN